MQGGHSFRGASVLSGSSSSQGAADERPSEWLTVSSKGLLVLVGLNPALPLAGQALPTASLQNWARGEPAWPKFKLNGHLCARNGPNAVRTARKDNHHLKAHP
jgi:hypothetical protein